MLNAWYQTARRNPSISSLYWRAEALQGEQMGWEKAEGKQGSRGMVVLWVLLRTCQGIKGCSTFPHIIQSCVSLDAPATCKEQKRPPWNQFRGEDLVLQILSSSASKDVYFPGDSCLCWQLLPVKCSCVLPHLSHYTFSISALIWIPCPFFFPFFYPFSPACHIRLSVKPLCCFFLKDMNSRVTLLQAWGKKKKRNQMLGFWTHQSYIYSCFNIVPHVDVSSGIKGPKEWFWLGYRRWYLSHTRMVKNCSGPSPLD